MNYDVKIYTFEKLKVIINGKDVTKKLEKIKNGKKVFQYLITYSDSNISEKELSSIIINNNSNIEIDSIINGINKLFKSEAQKLGFEIIKKNPNYYSFNKDINYWKDTEEFKEACYRTNRYLTDDIKSATSFFDDAVKLYKGGYLEETNSEEWLWEARNNYQSILINTFLKLEKQLKLQGDIDILKSYYEKLCNIIKYDEDLIINYLRLLIESDGFEKAEEKFKEIEAMFNNNGLIMPDKIKQYDSFEKVKLIEDPIEYFNNIDLVSSKSGAFYFNPSEFLKIFKLEKMKSERDNSFRCLVQFNLDIEEKQTQYSKDAETFNDRFREHLIKQLRGGDAITHWKRNYFLAILSNVNGVDAQLVMERLVTSFSETYNLNVEIKIEVLEIS